MGGLKIVFVASEMSPFAKTGGLADVVGSLPVSLSQLGHQVSVIMPKYSSIKANMELFHSPMGVWMGNKQEWCGVYKTEYNGISVYFIEHNIFFDRDGLYHDRNMNDYEDNPKRFAFLSRAAMQLCIDKGYSPDIFHVNDWQTALLPAYLKNWNLQGTSIQNSKSVLTIHNMAYQGNYPKSNVEYLGIGWGNFTYEKFEENDRINMLKGGIFYSDFVNTVSPTYAYEVTNGNGYGLDTALRNKGEYFSGIINGADYNIWNPEIDKYIRDNYSKEDMSGKWRCKGKLQDIFGLESNYTVPIFGAVGRFTSQKGYNLIASIAERLMNETSIQIAIIGTGDKDLEGFFSYMAQKYPGRFGCRIEFNEKTAHLLEAGSDFFLMPSLFEPCGLNQIYSLKYGTLPIVRNTGGLRDTVINCNEFENYGTGFIFNDFTPDALRNTILWAYKIYHTRPDLMAKMRYDAMCQDFSWLRSAKEYEHIYRKII